CTSALPSARGDCQSAEIRGRAGGPGKPSTERDRRLLQATKRRRRNVGSVATAARIAASRAAGGTERRRGSPDLCTRGEALPAFRAAFSEDAVSKSEHEASERVAPAPDCAGGSSPR